jgi:hypothetical protein
MLVERALDGGAVGALINAQEVLDVDALDDKHLVLNLDLAEAFTDQPALTRWNLARLQRASKRAGQSASGCSHDVIQRRRMLGLAAARDTVVIRDLVMDAEGHGLGLGRNRRAAQRASYTLDADARSIGDVGHGAILRTDHAR